MLSTPSHCIIEMNEWMKCESNEDKLQIGWVLHKVTGKMKGNLNNKQKEMVMLKYIRKNIP